MFGWIGNLFNQEARRPRRAQVVLPGLVSGLQHLMVAEALNELLAKLTDKRELLSAASLLLGIEERKLLARVAEKLGLPLVERVRPVDIALVPNWLPGRNIHDFRMAGAIPALGVSSFVGVVCVDPELLYNLMPETRSFPVALAPWQMIASAHVESERVYLSMQRESGDRKSHDQSQLAEKLLGRLLQEMVRHGGRSISINLLQPTPDYMIALQLAGQRGGDNSKAAGGKGITAKGLIHPAIVPGLQQLLSASLEAGLNTDFGMAAVSEISSGFKIDLLESGTVGKGIGSRGQQVTSRGGQRAGQGPASQGQPQASRGQQLPGVVVPFPGHSSARGGVNAQAEDATVPDSAESPDVLVIDDNKTFSQVMERFLIRQNLTCKLFEGGAEALAKLSAGEFSPKVIVTDLHMPELSGMEFLRALRQLPQFSETPVIMLTSDTDIEKQLQAIEFGADCYVKKSEDPRILMGQVQRLLTQRGASKSRVTFFPGVKCG